ncbi:hypothetical protein MTQ01_19265 [Streptomyces sp. XM4193]|uniref:hypothetical protein n=1 Tax=Streptomyces sp. XM4193 TaxID=2929782 RepID=UPI001FFAB105|nr:hypothetical protein [Streptomyces sp. XM4193]MCK1798129.1 hypothetical protein [Streptomyces sp. XM4193]
MKPAPHRRRAVAADLLAATGAVLLFVVAALVGHALENDHGTLRLHWPPLYAYADPHWGPGTPAALIVAALVVVCGPTVARRLSWRALLWASWLGSMAWIWSLALVDGWHRGVARRLTTSYEYLQSVGEVDDIPAMLREFTSRILMDAPDNWPPHVAGHPPGALLTFVWLDRIGLGGGAWGGVWCITLGATATAAVLVTLRTLGNHRPPSGPEALDGEQLARRAAPFLVLAPAAVWIGVSADGYFTAVAAWAVALLALAATRTVRHPRWAALGSGLLFGWVLHLSYGLVLLALLVAAVLWIARTLRPVGWVVLGALPVVVAFALAEFWWFEGYFTLVERYYQGAARVRPYGYYVWANLAAQVVVIGLATVAGLRRAATRRSRRRALPLVVLLLGALCTVLAADLSGMSKAETERIWLPFALWLLPAAALLPLRDHRWWLAAQAALALAVNHLLFTGW